VCFLDLSGTCWSFCESFTLWFEGVLVFSFPPVIPLQIRVQEDLKNDLLVARTFAFDPVVMDKSLGVLTLPRFSGLFASFESRQARLSPVGVAPLLGPLSIP